MLPNPIEQPALRAEQAAELYGISRGKAFELGRLYIATSGAEGIPCLRLGERLLRFPTARVLHHLGLEATS